LYIWLELGWHHEHMWISPVLLLRLEKWEE
jgi:hypothetical protein